MVRVDVEFIGIKLIKLHNSNSGHYIKSTS